MISILHHSTRDEVQLAITHRALDDLTLPSFRSCVLAVPLQYMYVPLQLQNCFHFLNCSYGSFVSNVIK